MAERKAAEAHLRPVPTAGRVLPHNLEAEQSLLGSMFLSQDAADDALGKLHAEDFYRPAHARVFEAMAHLNGRGQHVDHITVADRLEATGQLEAAGGREYLLEITRIVPTSANAEYYGEIVKRTSILRQLIGAATGIVQVGFDAPDDLDNVILDAEKAIFDVTNQRVQSNFRDIKELVKAGFEQIEALTDKPEHITGVASGFYDLDHLLAGFHPGDLIILAARPSVGKTALALNMAVGAAKHGARVGMFSLEMSSEQLVQRVLCAEARVDSHKLRTGQLGDDWHKVGAAANELNKLDMFVDDTPAISILELRAKSRRLLHGASQGLIVVDYLQLMQPQNRRSENRQTEIADISRGLKVLAKELSVPVLALSQLSRAVEQRPDKRPMLSDLRESGAIEQDADVVMFIHRDTRPRGAEDILEDDAKGAANFPPKGEAELIVAKHRNGPTDVVRLTYTPKYTRFGDATTRSR